MVNIYISGWWLSPTPLKNDGLSSSVGMMKFPNFVWQKKHGSKAPSSF